MRMQGRKKKKSDEAVLTCPPKYKAKRRQAGIAMDATQQAIETTFFVFPLFKVLELPVCLSVESEDCIFAKEVTLYSLGL